MKASSRSILAALLLAAAPLLQAQTLKIGLAEDPDVLDPSLARAPSSAASSSPRYATSCSMSTRS